MCLCVFGQKYVMACEAFATCHFVTKSMLHLCHIEHDHYYNLIIVLQMTLKQKLLNRLGKTWFQFSSRKMIYSEVICLVSEFDIK